MIDLLSKAHKTFVHKITFIETKQEEQTGETRIIVYIRSDFIALNGRSEKFFDDWLKLKKHFI